MRGSLFLIAACLLAAAPLGAANMPDAVFTERGACAELKVGSRDFTRFCKGEMVSYTHGPTGRVGFIFSFGEGTIQFSGLGPKQTKLSPNRSSQPLDRVMVSFKKEPLDVRTVPATGQCIYDNPFRGTARTTCRAVGGKGQWSAVFISNGDAPDQG